jgi:hypothetical protein
MFLKNTIIQTLPKTNQFINAFYDMGEGAAALHMREGGDCVGQYRDTHFTAGAIMYGTSMTAVLRGRSDVKSLPYFSKVMQLLLNNLGNKRHDGILSSKLFQR